MAIRLQLTAGAETSLGAWVPFGPSIPADYQRERVWQGWLEGHVQEPLRATLATYAREGNVRMEVVPAGAYPAPRLDLLRPAGLGDEEVRRLQEASHEIVVTASDALDGPRLAHLAVLAMARAMARHYQGVILDRDAPRLHPVDSHGRSIVPYVRARDFVAVAEASDPLGRQDLRTIGLRRFELPELRVEWSGTPRRLKVEVALLALAQILLYRARKAMAPGKSRAELVVPDEMQLSLEHEALGRGRFDAGAKSWAAGTTRVKLVLSVLGPGSPPFLRLLPPEGYKAGQASWLHAMTDELLGTDTAPKPPPKPRPSLEEGHKRALEELPELRARWKRGLPRGSQLFVRRAFPTPKDGPEYLWVAVSGWYDGKIRGELASAPRKRRDLHLGQHLQMQEDDLFDWLIRLSDGSEVGGFTVSERDF